ncbi:restriction endonuclease subunit S [Enterococcus faecalis]|nr:restriction endonuclease subunit S [Enterococcus faecalis]EGO9187027.1 restriction endonuclease subunit S [Enterococcus faecalis]EHS2358052.1 restriction endonuclease subunit S [Enterococcus faecalis]EJY9661231.1 restriction endonuclease subunit S [Enterococcus faecalis]MCD4875903.1 restriction endonuclease subunit S [Enterococcus faecalis]MCD4879121.1 restriction endonuclease subunit S [Enterococcus faecalis]
MRDEMKKVPRLRFRGFQEDWELCKVGDFGREIYGGGTPKTSVKEFWSGTLPWIQSSDLKEDKVCDIKAKKYISIKAIQQSSAKKISKNSIAIVTRVGVGKLALMPYEYATSQDFLSISVLQVDKWFGVYSLYNKLQSELNSVQGTSIKGITKDELLNKKIMIPKPLKEQSKIGLFLKKIDTTTALHQRKLDQLKELKKVYLQVMFPQKDETVPRMRFANFTGEWEQRELGSIGNTFTGLTGKAKEDFGHGDARFITYLNVFQNAVTSLEQLDSIEIDLKQNEVRKGDVFFTTSSETPDEVGMSSVWKYDCDNIYLNSFTFGYRPIIEFDLDYLASMLRSNAVRKKIIFLAQGISRYNISKTKMMNIEVPIPSLSEQAKIGAYLSNIEKTIALHQNKLNQLKSLKKSYLQNMFI